MDCGVFRYHISKEVKSGQARRCIIRVCSESSLRVPPAQQGFKQPMRSSGTGPGRTRGEGGGGLLGCVKQRAIACSIRHPKPFVLGARFVCVPTPQPGYRIPPMDRKEAASNNPTMQPLSSSLVELVASGFYDGLEGWSSLINSA